MLGTLLPVLTRGEDSGAYWEFVLLDCSISGLTGPATYSASPSESKAGSQPLFIVPAYSTGPFILRSQTRRASLAHSVLEIATPPMGDYLLKAATFFPGAGPDYIRGAKRLGFNLRLKQFAGANVVYVHAMQGIDFLRRGIGKERESLWKVTLLPRDRV